MALINWSMVRPCQRAMKPVPPPSIAPVTPTIGQLPSVVAKPCCLVAASTMPTLTPPPHVTVFAVGSTCTEHMRSMRMTSDLLKETPLWPPFVRHSSWPMSVAQLRSADTSLALVG